MNKETFIDIINDHIERRNLKYAKTKLQHKPDLGRIKSDKRKLRVNHYERLFKFINETHDQARRN